jgi:hypothetical protein
MKAAALLQKVLLLDPQALTSEVALEMATRNGAAALRLGAETGSLEVGKKADLAVVNLATPHSTPALKPVSSIVNCCQSADVTTVVVDGQVVMKDRQVLSIDEEEVIAKARETAARLLRQADAAAFSTPDGSPTSNESGRHAPMWLLCCTGRQRSQTTPPPQTASALPRARRRPRWSEPYCSGWSPAWWPGFSCRATCSAA